MKCKEACGNLQKSFFCIVLKKVTISDGTNYRNRFGGFKLVKICLKCLNKAIGRDAVLS